jgi:hypothetical protein
MSSPNPTSDNAKSNAPAPHHPSTPSSHLASAFSTRAKSVTPSTTVNSNKVQTVPAASRSYKSVTVGVEKNAKRYRKGGYGPVRGDRPLERSLIHRSTSPVQATFIWLMYGYGGTFPRIQDLDNTHSHSSSPCSTN